MAVKPPKPNSSPDETETPKVDFGTEPMAPAAGLPVLEDNPEDIEDFPEDYPDYYSGIEEGLIQRSAITILDKREDVRGRLAIIYTIATFIMFVLGFVVAILDAAWRQVSIIENLTTILPLISGIFLGSLGFVLGYYFRQIEGEDQK